MFYQHKKQPFPNHLATSWAWALQVTLLDNPLLSFTAALSRHVTPLDSEIHPKDLSFGPTSPWLQQRASRPLGPHACPGHPMKKKTRADWFQKILKIFWTYSPQSLRLLNCNTTCESSDIESSKRYHTWSPNCLEDVGIVTVGVLATKLIDLEADMTLVQRNPRRWRTSSAWKNGVQSM